MIAEQFPWILFFTLVCYVDILRFFNFFTVRGGRPGRTVQMTEAEVRALCLRSREIFLSQPILLELEAPLKICGKFLLVPFLFDYASGILESLSCGYTIFSVTILARTFLAPIFGAFWQP